MIRTTYSIIHTRELVEFAMARELRTEMEVELAQRLSLALDMIEEGNDT